MKVAINCRNLTAPKLEGFGNYTFEIVSRWIESHPEVEFLLIYDRKPQHFLPRLQNVKECVIPPATRHPILYFIWFEFQLTRLLRREKVDLFFSPDGYSSLGSKVKKVITIHDLNFEHNPKDLPFVVRNYLRCFFPKFARKADHILTVSAYSKNDIVKAYAIDPSKISVVYNAPNPIYAPVSESEKQAVRIEYTKGKPFFLFVGSLHPRKNVQRLLEAFSMLDNPPADLVIVGKKMWKNTDIQLPEKNQAQVHFVGYLDKEKLAKVMGSALALTYVPYFEGFGIPMVEAMACGTPLIAANATCLPEIAGDAALYCDPFSIKDIHAAMEQLLNDGELRETLKQKGLERVKNFSWDKAAKEAWEKLQTVF
jgi:glycosyltransferase involved in cell wall biosynthesis